RARRMIRRGLFALLVAVFLIPGAGSSGVSGPVEGHKLQSRPVSGQAVAGPAAAVAPAWESLVARLAAAPAVSWNPGSGTPGSLFGRLSEAAPAVTEGAARR